jgi:hypothetical protein
MVVQQVLDDNNNHTNKQRRDKNNIELRQINTPPSLRGFTLARRCDRFIIPDFYRRRDN